MMHYYNDGSRSEAELVILINMNPSSVDFTLPSGRSWARILDTQAYFDLDGDHNEPTGYFNSTEADSRKTANVSLENDTIVGTTYSLPGFSIAILEQR